MKNSVNEHWHVRFMKSRFTKILLLAVVIIVVFFVLVLPVEIFVPVPPMEIRSATLQELVNQPLTELTYDIEVLPTVPWWSFKRNLITVSQQRDMNVEIKIEDDTVTYTPYYMGFCWQVRAYCIIEEMILTVPAGTPVYVRLGSHAIIVRHSAISWGFSEVFPVP